MHKHNAIFNKTETKIVTILTKCFFSYLNPTSYLNGKSQKIKLSSSFSSELDVSYAIPQGSILVPRYLT